MGYRGYKSIVLSNFIAAIVKEQRVNGSYYVSYISYIRSTLRDFEINSQVRFLSTGINIKQRSGPARAQRAGLDQGPARHVGPALDLIK